MILSALCHELPRNLLKAAEESVNFVAQRRTRIEKSLIRLRSKFVSNFLFVIHESVQQFDRLHNSSKATVMAQGRGGIPLR